MTMSTLASCITRPFTTSRCPSAAAHIRAVWYSLCCGFKPPLYPPKRPPLRLQISAGRLPRDPSACPNDKPVAWLAIEGFPKT